jgi:hypothetical protein
MPNYFLLVTLANISMKFLSAASKDYIHRRSRNTDETVSI